MKLRFLELSPDERRLYIEQAASRRNVSPVILENHALAGTPVSLPVVAASRFRLPQTLGQAGVRLAHRPATGRPPPGTAVGGRRPA